MKGLKKIIMNNHYIVDRIEGDIAVLEDSNKNMINANIKDIQGSIIDGDALIKINDKYIKDDTYKKERERIIKEKFERLKRSE